MSCNWELLVTKSWFKQKRIKSTIMNVDYVDDLFLGWSIKKKIHTI